MGIREVSWVEKMKHNGDKDAIHGVVNELRCTELLEIVGWERGLGIIRF